jgi:hypothetical protein
MVGADPVELGFVENLRRPGGNMTGVSALAVGTPAKRLQLVGELMLTAGEIAFLRNPNNPNFSALETRELQGAAAAAATSFQVRSHYAVFPTTLVAPLAGARIETCPALQFRNMRCFTSGCARRDRALKQGIPTRPGSINRLHRPMR